MLNMSRLKIDMSNFSFLFVIWANSALEDIFVSNTDIAGQCLNSQSGGGTCGPKYTFQDKDHSRKDLRRAPGFPRQNSGKSPERFWIARELVISEGNCSVSTELLESDSLFHQTADTNCQSLSLVFPRDLSYVVLVQSRMICVQWWVGPRMFLVVVSTDGC